MFTGIIEEIGTVTAIKKGTNSAKITMKGNKVLGDLTLGDSVATNGVCLTVTSINGTQFTVDVMNETLSHSTLGSLTIGGHVNLERAMLCTDRFGGHMVTGHINGTGTISSIRKDDIAIWYIVKTTPQIMKYIVEKGSIAIDGISLTVVNVEKDSFSVSVIPHTAKETTLAHKHIGSVVNLENDIIGKYVEKLLNTSQGITKEFLLRNGY